MESKRFFIGDIRIITSYEETYRAGSTKKEDEIVIETGEYVKEHKLYKKGAILFKTMDEKFIDVENLNKILLGPITKDFMTTTGYQVGELFVDKITLKECLIEHEQKKLAVLQLKRK